MIIDCHGHYTTEPAAHHAFREAQVAQARDRAAPEAAVSRDLGRRDPRDGRGQPAALLRERGRRHDDLLAARIRDGAPHRRRGDERRVVAQVERPDRPHRRHVSRQFRRRLPASAIAGGADRELDPGARPLCQRARVRRLQPQSRSVRRALDGAAADRPVLVSALREDGRARRSRHGPRVGVMQRLLPHDRRPLHQRRHHRVHAAPAGRPLQRLPRAADHHPAWRGRRALSLGPVSRAWPTCSRSRR